VGVLNRLVNKANAALDENSHREASNDDAWREWAQARSWSYVPEDASLVGRWFPPFSTRDKDALETCRHVARGADNGCEVIVCEWEYYASNEDSARSNRIGLIAVKVPHPMSAAFEGHDAERICRKGGGAIPNGYSLYGAPPDWLVARGQHDLRTLASAINLLTTQISQIPASFWQA
jgi:hypothetical protein